MRLRFHKNVDSAPANRVQSARDLESFMDFRVLGELPQATPPKRPPRPLRFLRALRPGNAAITAPDTTLVPGAQARDAYTTLAAQFANASNGDTATTLLVTSPNRADGKSVVSLNLAAALSARGIRTCHVDANMRRPTLHETYGLSLHPGLALYLEGIPVPEIFEQPTSCDALAVVTAGESTEAPDELLRGTRMRALLDLLRDRHDVVILDAPALNEDPEAALLVDKVDVRLLVVRPGATKLADCVSCIQLLREQGLTPMPGVLNGVRHSDANGGSDEEVA